MHKLSEITIQNFRSICSASFPLSEYTPLVGNNNVGKSNLLRAIGWFLKKASLSESDFFDVSSPVIVEGTISGVDDAVLEAIDEKHRKRVAPHVRGGKLRLRRCQSVPGVSTKDLNIEVFAQDDKGGFSWVVNPGGIEAAILGLLPEPIFIGAMENAADDVAKFSSTSTIGKLLREVIAPINARYADEVAEALAPVGSKISSNGAEKDESLRNFDNMIAEELSPLFPGIIARTHIPLPGFSEFFKGATLKIAEGDGDFDERDVSSFGHGVQRSVQIALVKCLARAKAGDRAEARTTVILVDEPELYLHPQAIESTRAAFKALAGDQYQVIFSTHAPAMIHRKDVPHTLLMRREDERGTFALTRIAEAVSRAIDSADHQADLLFDLGNASRILFTDKVILCEGKSERVLLPELFRRVTGKSLEEHKMALVQVDSVDSIVKTRRILLEMGMPVLAIADLDFACRGAVVNALIPNDNADLLSCKATLSALAEKDLIGLDEGGLPKKHKGVLATKAYEILAYENQGAVEGLHTQLRNDHCIWVWQLGTIESHLGLDSKQTSVQRRFVEQLEEEGFFESLNGHAGVRDAMFWLAGE